MSKSYIDPETGDTVYPGTVKDYYPCVVVTGSSFKHMKIIGGFNTKAEAEEWANKWAYLSEWSIEPIQDARLSKELAKITGS